MNHTLDNDIDTTFGKRQSVEFVRLDQKANEAQLISKESVYELPLEVGILHIQPVRTYWGPGQPRPGQSPICKSGDGKVGSQFGECEKCEHSVWKNRQAPGCRAGWEITFATLDDDETPKVFRCERSGFNAGLGLARLKKGRIPYEDIIKFDATRVNKGNLTYVPTFLETRDAIEVELERFKEMRNALDGGVDEEDSGTYESDKDPQEQDVPDFSGDDLKEMREKEVDFTDFQ